MIGTVEVTNNECQMLRWLFGYSVFTLISTSEADSAYCMVWICCVVLNCVVCVEEDGEGTVYHISGAACTAYWCCCTHHLPSAGQQGFDIVLLFF